MNPENRLCRGIAAVKRWKDEMAERRFALPYDTDGLVVKVNDLDLQKRLGAASKFPRWAVAFKYPPQEETTRVERIWASVGRTGVLTPVVGGDAGPAGRRHRLPRHAAQRGRDAPQGRAHRRHGPHPPRRRGHPRGGEVDPGAAHRRRAGVRLPVALPGLRGPRRPRGGGEGLPLHRRGLPGPAGRAAHPLRAAAGPRRGRARRRGGGGAGGERPRARLRRPLRAARRRPGRRWRSPRPGPGRR